MYKLKKYEKPRLRNFLHQHGVLLTPWEEDKTLHKSAKVSEEIRKKKRKFRKLKRLAKKKLGSLAESYVEDGPYRLIYEGFKLWQVDRRGKRHNSIW